MNVIYVVQNISMDLAQSSGTQLHIRGVLQGIQSIAEKTRVVGIQGLSAYEVDQVQQIGMGSNLQTSALPLELSKNTLFLEKPYRRLQALLKLPYLGIWDSWRLFDACRLIDQPVDIFHAHFDYIPLGAALASRNRNWPLVLDCEGDWFDEYRQMLVTLNPIQAGWARLCQRFCFDTSRAIICVTDELKNYLIHAWNIPASKIFVLSNGVDPDFFRSVSVQNAGTIRHKYAIGNDLVVMFVGGFYPRHALDQLVHSFKIVKEQIGNCKLILVGDGQTRNQVFELVKSLQMEDSVIFTDAIDYEDIPDMISIADVMVSPSLEYSLEGSQESIKTSPLKLLEYMAAGKPCVATATSPQKKVVVNGENGILVKPGDIKEFATALLELLSNPAERARLGKNASEYVARHHSWQAYAEKLIKIYQYVLADHDTGAQNSSDYANQV